MAMIYTTTQPRLEQMQNFMPGKQQLLQQEVMLDHSLDGDVSAPQLALARSSQMGSEAIITKKPEEAQTCVGTKEIGHPRSIETITIPDMFVSFVAQRPQPNPYHQEVKKQSIEDMWKIMNWTYKDYQKHMKADFPYFAAIWTTEAACNEFRTIVDWCNWVFDFDDLFDDGNLKEDPIKAREELAASLDILTNPNHQTYTAGDHPLRHVFQSVWRRIKARSSKGAQTRYIKSMEGFFSGLIGQVEVRSNATTRDYETYLALRRESIGVYPCLALVEYFQGLDIPDYVFADPAIKEIECLAADFVLLQNDILSFHKEQAMDVNHNIIHLFKERGLSQQQAYDSANDLLLDRYRQWYIAHARVPIWGEEVDVQVQQYLKGCQDVVLGNLNWSFESERYFGKHNDQVRKTRVVPGLY